MCNFPTKLSVKNENVSFREHLFIYEKKKFKKASQLHHNSENSKPEINPPDQWQNTSEFLF